MSRKLIVNDGRRERELLLVGTMVVGRDPTCDISDADPLLSRRHVEFVASSKEVTVRDLGSRNGILVNGVKIAQSVLRTGDVVQVGHLQVRLVEDAAAIAMPADDTALGPTLPPRRTAAAAAQPRVTSATAGARSSVAMDEPTQRVVRAEVQASSALVDTELDRTIPTLPDAEKTRFAEPTARMPGPAANRATRGAADPDRTRFESVSVPVLDIQPPALSTPPPSVSSSAASAAAWRSAVLVQVIVLAAIVFLATAISLIMMPPNGANRIAVVLIVPAAVTLLAAWFTSRQIQRQVLNALPQLDEESRRSSGRNN